MKLIAGGAGYVLLFLVFLGVLATGLHHLNQILAVTTTVADIALAMALPCLLLSIVPRARRFAGSGLVVISYCLGVNVWFSGVDVVFTLWGLIALIIGLFCFGIGPVPMGIIALLFHHQASDAGMLLLGVALMFIIRLSGAALKESGERFQQQRALERGFIAKPQIQTMDRDYGGA